MDNKKNDDLQFLDIEQDNITKEQLERAEAGIHLSEKLIMHRRRRFLENVSQFRIDNADKLQKMFPSNYKKDEIQTRTMAYTNSALLNSGPVFSTLPASQHPRVKHVIKNEGSYYLDVLLDDFPVDAIQTLCEGWIDFSMFDQGKIKPSNNLDEDHRDAIQLIPPGWLHFSGFPVRHVNFWGMEIESTVGDNLQGIAAFDGLLIDVNIYGANIKVDSTHGITFNGLMYGNFQDITVESVNDSDAAITLNPLKLCGGGYFEEGKEPIPTIYIVGPWIDNYDQEHPLYYRNILEDNVSPPIIDNRNAFSKVADGYNNTAAETRFRPKLHANTKVYSHLKISALWYAVINSEPYTRDTKNPDGTPNKDKSKQRQIDIMRFTSDWVANPDHAQIVDTNP